MNAENMLIQAVRLWFFFFHWVKWISEILLKPNDNGDGFIFCFFRVEMRMNFPWLSNCVQIRKSFTLFDDLWFLLWGPGICANENGKFEGEEEEECTFIATSNFNYFFFFFCFNSRSFAIVHCGLVFRFLKNSTHTHSLQLINHANQRIPFTWWPFQTGHLSLYTQWMR